MRPQCHAILDLLSDGQWHTVGEISDRVQTLDARKRISEIREELPGRLAWEWVHAGGGMKRWRDLDACRVDVTGCFFDREARMLDCPRDPSECKRIRERDRDDAIYARSVGK